LGVASGSAGGGVCGVASVRVSSGAWPPASTNSPLSYGSWPRIANNLSS
jgi:hypothetical protein